MWHKLEFEESLEKSLTQKYGSDKGAKYYIRYSSFRDKIIDDNALNGIPAFNPGLTDHSAEHIAHVMQNVYKLLGEEPEKYINPLEYYCLALLILFHDTGNLFGREGHEKNVFKVYEFFKGSSDNRQERSIIIRGTAAHGGQTSNGSTDTLRQLTNSESFDGEKIRLQEISSLLRFGDELAEGLNRTSLFMQKYGLYPETSLIYHEYSKITSILIDRGTERISIAYNFDLKSDNYNQDSTKKLLDFTIKRLHKLDVERRYNKNYSECLSPFKITAAQFNFWIDGQLNPELDLAPIQLEDQFPLPGENIADCSNLYINSDELLQKINNIILQ